MYVPACASLGCAQEAKKFIYNKGNLRVLQLQITKGLSSRAGQVFRWKLGGIYSPAQGSWSFSSSTSLSHSFKCLNQKVEVPVFNTIGALCSSPGRELL